jgi:hypothetical protein
MKQETLEEAVNNFKKTDVYINEIKQQQDKKMYSEEDMKESFINGALTDLFNTWGISDKDMAKEKFDDWFEQFKKK